MPTLIGNIIGGVSLVAALNHAQVTAGGGEEGDAGGGDGGNKNARPR